MANHEKINHICAWIVACTLVVTVAFTFFGKAAGIQAYIAEPAYADSLFDTSRVHTVDIQIDTAAWETLLANASDKEYQMCSVVIDGEKVADVGVRAKGNSSLTSVKSSDSDRYSLKLEFDHYKKTNTYNGLDKLSLNNVIQDNTYLKEYLSYNMMQAMGVKSPLCSFASVSINGELFGLYVAVEAVEDSFALRNYGGEAGKLYKPENMDMDGMNGGNDNQNQGRMGGNQGGFGNRMGGPSSDVALVYTDDEFTSYQHIFDGAVSDISDADKERLIASLKKLNSSEDLDDILNVEQVLKYFVVHDFVNNFDSYTGSMMHNYYLRELNGQLSIIPWDYNLAFSGMTSGSDATAQVNFPIDTPVSGTTLEARPLLAKLLENENYLMLYHQYFSEFMTSYFDSGTFEKVYTDAVNLITPYVQSDPTAFCTYEQFQKGTVTLKEYCLLRAQSVKGQLSGEIPSTQSGQQAASEKLISASSISLSDMGAAMGGWGGFGAGGMGGRQGQPMGNRQAANNAQAQSAQPEASATPSPGESDTTGGATSAGQTTSAPQDNSQSTPAPSGSTQEPQGNGVQNNPSPPGQQDGVGPGQMGNGNQMPPVQGQMGYGDLASDQGLPIQNFQGFGQRQGDASTQTQADTTVSVGNQPILLGISLLVFVAGLAFAFLYRRKK